MDAQEAEQAAADVDEVIANQGNMELGIVESSEEELRDMVMLYNVEERKDARIRQQHILDVVASLGGDSRAYRRERARKAKAIVAEFYSPPRISALARDLPSYGIAPGLER